MKFKKAFIAASITDFYAILVYILIILIFSLLFLSLKGCESEQSVSESDIIIEKTRVDANYINLHFLKIELNDSETQTMADLIIKSNNDDDFYNLLEPKIETYFNANYEDNWHLHIFYPTYKKELGHSYGWDVIGESIEEQWDRTLDPLYLINFVIPGFQTFLSPIPLANQEKIYLYLPTPTQDLIKIEFAYWEIKYWSVFYPTK